MNKGLNRKDALPPIATILASAMLTAGCQHPVNPFADELAQMPPATTPSVDALLDREIEEAAVLQRPYDRVERPWVDGAVTHVPLYFEDPFDLPLDNAEPFAWTGEDYFASAYGSGRFLGNAVFFPLSAVVLPPWTLMASDGVPAPSEPFGEWRDAVRYQTRSVQAEPPDHQDVE